MTRYAPIAAPEPPPIGAARLTVAICTRNRAGQLRLTLEALAAARVPAPGGWEVVVVLNDCSDDSAAVALQFVQQLPLVVVQEPRAGLSHARNRAVAVASGDYILWIDDDVRVHPDCLVAYRDAIARYPDAAILAGPIRVVFDRTPPDWLVRSLPVLGSAYAATAERQNGDTIMPGALPYGANFVVRTDVQRRYPYDPELGRAPLGWLRSGEDTDVMGRILADGARGSWVADAAVDHRIAADRQTVEYFQRYFEGYGRTTGLIRRRARPRPWRDAPADFFSVVAADLRFWIARRFETPERWSRRLVKSAVRRGRWKANYL